MGPERAAMAVRFGKNDNKIQGEDETQGNMKERDEEDRERFRRMTERVTDCQGKNHLNQTTTKTEGMGQAESQAETMSGLEPPRLAEGNRPVVGEDIKGQY